MLSVDDFWAFLASLSSPPKGRLSVVATEGGRPRAGGMAAVGGDDGYTIKSGFGMRSSTTPQFLQISQPQQSQWDADRVAAQELALTPGRTEELEMDDTVVNTWRPGPGRW